MAEELTDDELRRQLQAYGVDKLGPITETTRAIYIKRLNHYRAAEKKASRGGGRVQRGRKLAAFSSDESEDESLEPEEGRVNSRRRSSRTASRTAAPAPTTTNWPTTRRRNPRGRPNSNNTSEAKERGDHVAPAGRRSLGSRYDDFDSSDANDLDDDEVDHESARAPEMVSRSINTSSFLDSSYLDKTYTHDTSVRENQRSRPSLGRDRGLRQNSSLASPLSTPNSLNYRSPPKGNHLTPGGQSLDEKFRKRYSNNSYMNSHDRSYLSEEEEKIKKDGFKTESDEDTSWFSEGFDTSRIVLVSGVLFFLALALVYLGISFNSSHPFGSIGRDRFPEIENEGDELLFHIFEVVSRKTGEDCGQDNNRMRIDDVVTQVCDVSKPQCTKRDIQNALKKQVKYFNDTDLPIKLHTSSGTETAEFHKAEYISAPPRLTIWCRLINSAHKVAFYFFLGILVLGAVYVVVKSVQYYKKKKDEETQRVIELVERIIDILASHHDESVRRQDNREYVAISHVRDILIPIQQRKKMQPLWDKAVKFLSANESRVRVETQKIAGEEFAVWRWLPMHICVNGGKVWQGQAFGEHKELALNSAPYSYTPCLKIRNMFDTESEWEEDWHVRIQDAILEKCGDEHGIVHIAVDKSSKEGCVFVKCVSNVYSGKAYKALHGWWFNGNLVTVKYLRLERYHERFPDAKYCSEPMQPSNNQCLSLSQPFHRSVIEFS